MRSTLRPGALQRGFTLIEAMTAGLVLSIITIGLMSAWTVAGANVNDLVVRKKAIWTLNGHMERISALYQFTDFGAFGISTSTGYDYPAAYNDTRMIFGTFADAAMAPPGTTPLFKAFVGEANGLVERPNDFETKDGYPVVLFDSLTSSVRRNYIWIDRPKNIVGRLSWELTDFVVAECDGDNQPDGSEDCRCLSFAHDASDPDPGTGSGAFCKEIQLALEFPLRWNEADNTVKAMPQPTEILTIRPIVGRIQ